jgi:iron complex transport system ATP-binding protein
MNTQTLCTLQAHGLNVSLDGRQVLQGVDLQIQPGWTCVTGPNGAGKSTLLQALAGLLPCTGEVLLQGRPLHAWAGRERAQRLSWLGQNDVGADDLTVYDVAMLGRLPHQTWLAAPSDEDRHVVETVLRRTQSWDWRHRPLGQLSGGERQRVLLARALAVQAPVLLMDEPLVNLDPPHQADWLAWVQDLVAEGVTVLSVLHELNMALQADTLIVMKAGQVVCHAGTHAQRTHDALQAVFDQRIRLHAITVEGQVRWVALPHR